MKNRTTQDLLGERRLLVIDSMHERDKTTKAMLAAQIADIDREIGSRNHAAAIGGAK